MVACHNHVTQWNDPTAHAEVSTNRSACAQFQVFDLGKITNPALPQPHFVAQAAASGLRTVLVITGKGHHSPGGRGILRQKVEEWIRERGWRRIRTWSEAPARLGGAGRSCSILRAAHE